MYDSQNVEVALSRIYNETIRENENRTGFYRAIVVQNYDPLNLGRVRIRIPSFHGVDSDQSYYISDNDLPLAYPGSFNGASNLTGEYILPLVGSLVWVSFETGTDNFVYFGGIYTAKPQGNRYIYYDRNVNNGEPKQIIEDDIPADYNASKYIIFKSPKGASIEIDDRDTTETVTVSDSHGNKVQLGPLGVNIISNNMVTANYPYLTSYYIDEHDATNDIEFTVLNTAIFSDVELTTNVEVTVGCKIVYVKNGKCAGSGIVIKIDGNNIIISNNGKIV